MTKPVGPEGGERAALPELRIGKVASEGELFSALALREIVFIEEESIPESLERDAEDAGAFHLLCFDSGHAVGTGRLVLLDSGPEGAPGIWGRIGRMAVLKSHRKRRVGSLLLDALEKEARRRGCIGALVHAQVHCKEFYLKRGFTPFGEEFEEAGIPHIGMSKRYESGEAALS